MDKFASRLLCKRAGSLFVMDESVKNGFDVVVVFGFKE